MRCCIDRAWMFLPRAALSSAHDLSILVSCWYTVYHFCMVSDFTIAFLNTSLLFALAHIFSLTQSGLEKITERERARLKKTLGAHGAGAPLLYITRVLFRIRTRTAPHTLSPTGAAL